MRKTRTPFLAAALAVVSGSALALGLGGAQAAPRPSPTPTPTAAPYTLGQEVVSKTETKPSDSNEVNAIEVSCPVGKVPTGGGFYANSDYPIDRIVENRPTATGWRVAFGVAGTPGGEDSISTGTVYAVCANAR